ncbi:MAG TPA: ABC transporter permease [Dehalococcoidia bacterium]|nr:ABC transporter permease [Dehalococcoidia bacterium]
MTEYILRRLLLNLVVIWLAASFVFVTMRVLPGDFAAQQVSNQFLAGAGGSETPEEALQVARERLGLNHSVPVQYGKYWWDIARGDFGRSFLTSRTAIDHIKDALPYSLQLGLMQLTIALVVALPVGIISAIRQDTLIDNVFRIFAITGLAAPSFWTASLLVLVVLRTDIWEIDIVGHPGIWEDPVGSLQLFIIPALAGGIASGAVLMRMLRSQMLDVLRQDYVRTAWSKGLRERNIIIRHTLKNAMIPVVTIIGFLVAAMIGGTVILEQMFNIPGMGQNLLRSIMMRDVPLAQTFALVLAAGVVTINLIVDISYFFIDPRVTVQGSAT